MVGVVNSKASQPTSSRKIKVGKEFHSEDIFRSMIALMCAQSSPIPLIS